LAGLLLWSCKGVAGLLKDEAALTGMLYLPLCYSVIHMQIYFRGKKKVLREIVKNSFQKKSNKVTQGQLCTWFKELS
jgi:hypothetical protein